MKYLKFGAGLLTAALMSACGTVPPRKDDQKSDPAPGIIDKKCGHLDDVAKKLCEVQDFPGRKI